MKKSAQGFTLVELLVVISIIGILSVVGLITYTSALKQGRDSKRQSDLNSIQLALEQYNNDQGYYPLLNTGACSNGTFKIGCALKDPTGSKPPYINIIPDDPLSTQHYCYTPTPTSPACDNTADKFCTSYQLYAQLENIAPGTSSCNSVSTYNFAVTPP